MDGSFNLDNALRYDGENPKGPFVPLVQRLRDGKACLSTNWLGVPDDMA